MPILSVLCFVSLLTGMQADSRQVPLSDHRPPELPAMLAKQKSVSVSIGSFSIRGFKTITTRWELPRSVEQVIDALKPNYVSGFGSSDTGGRWATKICADRTIEISLEKDMRRSPRSSTGWVWYTWVTFTEQPLPVGDLPKDWPKEAMGSIPLPKNAPRPPFPECQREPDLIGPAFSEGRSAYSTSWFVHESEETAFPRWLNSLEASGLWEVRRDKARLGGSASLKSDKRAVDLLLPQSGTYSLALPKGWCMVHLAWNEVKD